MADRRRAAVVLTHDRPDDFVDCFDAVAPQVDRVFVVGHRAPYGANLTVRMGGTYIHYGAETCNISVAWTLGLTTVAAWANAQPYDVAVLNDDAIVPAGWMDLVTAAMRRAGAAAGAVARPGDPRMAGYAFVLDGSAGIYADPQFEWWYGDDDIALQAEARGGVVQPRGPAVEHRHPNSTTVGVLAERAAEDAVRFKRKWKR